VPVRLPPLRERVEDIPLLARHFLALYWERHRQRSGPMPTFTQGVLDFLCTRVWRGNVRELQNVIEHVAVLAEPGMPLHPEDIPMGDDPAPLPTATSFPAGMLDEAYHLAKDRLVTYFEREYLSRLVARAGGNMSKAARLASIDRTTLYRLMEKHGEHRSELSDSPR